MTVQVIKNCDTMTQVQFEERVYQLDDLNWTIGILTESCLHKLLDEGDIGVQDQEKFTRRVTDYFYIDAVTQALE